MSRYPLNEELNMWLFELAKGKLSDEQLIKGFIKHYVLQGYTIGSIKADALVHPYLKPSSTSKAWKNLSRALENYIRDDDVGRGEQKAGSTAGRSMEPAKR